MVLSECVGVGECRGGGVCVCVFVEEYCELLKRLMVKILDLSNKKGIISMKVMFVVLAKTLWS